MIPSQIFCGIFRDQKNREIEVRALEMAPDYFSFRLSKKWRGEAEEFMCSDAVLHFYIDERKMKRRENGPGKKPNRDRGSEQAINSACEIHPEGRYDTEIMVRGFRIVPAGEAEFWDEYRFETDHEDYRRAAKALLREYGNYIRLKLNETDETVARSLTGYPVDESKISASFEKQKAVWFAKSDGFPLEGGFSGEFLGRFSGEGENCGRMPELGIALWEPALWERYLREESLADFCGWYRSDRVSGDEKRCCDGAERTESAKNEIGIRIFERIRYFYIGNPFCPHLYPDAHTLSGIRKKTEKDGVSLVYVFSTMSETQIPVYQERLDDLVRNSDGKPVSIEVNDLGMLELIRQRNDRECFHITLGVIPIRRRKDTRLLWTKEPDRWKNQRTTVDDDSFRRKMSSLGVRRWSIESCSAVPESMAQNPQEQITVYYPYYVMNTSTWCTTYAMCHNGARGRQEEVRQCPGYCRTETFLYPDDLHMVGRFNSLFGLDLAAPERENRLRDLVRQGADRIVLNYL